MLSRRELIGKTAVGAAATLAVSTAGIASARALRAATDGGVANRDGGKRATGDGVAEGHESRDPAVPGPDTEAIVAPPPWELVHPLGAGSAVAHGWRLVDLSPVRHGSCVATLENARGRSHRIHLCRNDGDPQGLIFTRRLDLVVMNEGQGDLPTEEGLAQAVAALAHVVAANERKLPDGVLAELLPHTERVRRYAAADGPTAGGWLR